MVSVSASMSQRISASESPWDSIGAISTVGSPPSVVIFSTRRRASSSSASANRAISSARPWYWKPTSVPAMWVYAMADRCWRRSATLSASIASSTSIGSFLFSFTRGGLSGTGPRGRAGRAHRFDPRNVRTFRPVSRRTEGPSMADELSPRDTKLIQYLNEAYGKEKELETALQAHIRMTKRPPYKKRLQDHLKETKAQSKGLERRIKALGGKAERSTPVPV